MTHDEEIVNIGSENHLVGILSLPREPPQRDEMMLFLNAGVIHRVGPHRMHVRLARRYAKAGGYALRLDLGGVGDSRPVHTDVSVREGAVADVREAMEAMTTRTGKTRFLLFGLCSGADNAVATALADDRVRGLVLIDPAAYPTPRAKARKFAAKAAELQSPARIARWGVGVVARKLRARLDPEPSTSADVDPGAGEIQQGRRIPPRDVFGAQLTQLVDRGTNVLAVYTGSLDDRYNHPDQLFEVFPQLRDRVTVAFCPDANHMFTELDAQQQLTAAMDGWLERL